MASRTALRTDAPRDYWHGAVVEHPLGIEQFRITALRGKLEPLLLDNLVESITWTEPQDSAIFTGELTFREMPYTTKPLVLNSGDVIKCEVAESATQRFRLLWRMRVREPAATASSGSRTLALINDLVLLGDSIDDFKYNKGKKHPKGWRIDQAIRDVCGRYGLKLGTLAQMTHHVKKKVWLDTSPLRVLNDLLAAEKNYTGRRFNMRFDNTGKLNIVPLRRSKELLTLGPTLIEASLQESMKEGYATALTVRATAERTLGKDKKGRKRVRNVKIAVKVRSEAAVKRFGYVHRIVYAHGADSASEARTMGLYHLSRIAKPDRTMTLNHVGIPTLKKGDALRMSLPELGVKQIVFVSEITHTVQAGSYSMDVTVTFDDPYVDKKADRVNENKIEAATTRNRPTKKSSTKKNNQPAANANKRDKIPKPPQPKPGDELKKAGQH